MSLSSSLILGAGARAPSLSRRLESPYLLNALEQTSVLALGLRKLREEYTGPAIRLQNAGGNTGDVGFTAGGDLDWAAVRAFSAGGPWSVAIWFDQSGNNRFVSQATFANMPTLQATSGQLGGRSALNFDGSNDTLTRISPSSLPLTSGQQQYTQTAVYRTGVLGTRAVCEQNHSSVVNGRRACMIVLNFGNQGWNGEFNDAHMWSAAANTDYAAAYAVDNAVTPNVVGRVNTVPNTATTGGRTTANVGAYGLWIGSKLGSSEFWLGQIAEVIWFGFAMTPTQARALTRRQGAHFNIATE